MTLGSAQTPTEMSITVSHGDKGGQGIRLTTFSLSFADFLEVLGTTKSWSPKGLSRFVVG